MPLATPSYFSALPVLLASVSASQLQMFPYTFCSISVFCTCLPLLLFHSQSQQYFAKYAACAAASPVYSTQHTLLCRQPEPTVSAHSFNNRAAGHTSQDQAAPAATVLHTVHGCRSSPVPIPFSQLELR